MDMSTAHSLTARREGQGRQVTPTIKTQITRRVGADTARSIVDRLCHREEGI
jgi:hypothetical protein